MLRTHRPLSRRVAALGAASLALFALAACGGGGGSAAPPIQPKPKPTGATFKGKVTLESASKPQRSQLPPDVEDAEPNSSAFDAQDAGGSPALRTFGGEVGGNLDPIDFFRFGPLDAGTVAARSDALGTRLVVMRLAAGKAPAIAIHRGSRRATVAIARGDHVVVGVRAVRPTTYRLRVSHRAEDVTPTAELAGPAATAVYESWLPPAAELRAGEVVVVPQEGREQAVLQMLAALGFREVDAGGGIYRMRVGGPAAAPGDAGRAALADVLFEARRVLPGLAVSPNFVRRLHAEPNDTYYKSGEQWSLKLCKVLQAWDSNKGGNAVVGIVDSGWLKDHEDLKDKLLDGYDFDGKDEDPEEADTDGSGFHGAHVAGIAAASTNNGLGIAGVAWESKIVVTKGIDDFAGAQGILFCAGLDNSSGRKAKQAADVINMSFGGPTPSASIKAAIDKARAAGKILVGSAGNAGKRGDPAEYPAAREGVIAVGAVGRNGKLAPYSSTGMHVDIVAPGGDETIAGPPNGKMWSAAKVEKNGKMELGYVAYEGTSQAAPFVTGAIALMKSANRELGYGEILTILENTAINDPKIQPDNIPGRDVKYGVGLIDVEAALKFALIPSLLTADRRSIQLGSADKTASVVIKLRSGGTSPKPILELVTTPTKSTGTPGWLSSSLSAKQTPADLTVQIDRAKLAAGTWYHGAVQVESDNGGDISVPVTLFTPPPANKQPIKVVLADSKTGEIIKDEAGQPKYQAVADGNGAFQITGIPAGTYKVLAGVDENQDSDFADAGDWSVQDVNVIGDESTTVTLAENQTVEEDLDALYVHRRDVGKF